MHTTERQALGIDTSHLVKEGLLSNIVHKSILEDFLLLQKAAKTEGIALKIVSGYRSFERQLHIWNSKAKAQRPVYDSATNVVDMSLLSTVEKVQAICRYSAIPGLSRHHWGTDIDVVDSAVHNPKIELTVPEARQKYAKLHSFLDNYLPDSAFYRPYSLDRGTVAVEPWHISHRRVATVYQRLITQRLIYALLEPQEMALKEEVLDNLKKYISFFIY